MASRTSPQAVQRLFAAGPHADHRAHLATYGPQDRGGSVTLFGELERSGLTGRGGAGFAAWRKVLATDDARTSRAMAGRPVVIANGAEGEPRSLKDKTLLEHAPHLVIDGLLAAAAAVHAGSTYLYAASRSLEPIAAAITEREDADSIVLREAPDTFIAGEASAVVNGIENGIALPQDRIRRLSDTGLKRRPTLVHNAETLAHLALIARYGSGWFRTAGTSRDPGTRLVTVSGDVPQQRVMEVPGGAVLGDMLLAAGVDIAAVGAVLVGGYHGAWVPADVLDAPLSADGLAPLGAAPGAGVLLVLGRRRCGLRATADIAGYLADQSARQCGPCMFGLPELARMLGELAAGIRDKDLPARLRALSADVAGRGSCHHPDGTTRMIASALGVFRDDVHAHLAGRCLAAEGR
ncbi:hypothetical protein HII28_05360 [Planctomonas sp. JC2975]|nr:hypothetical protein [Planctomonas sp. JC2975]